MKMLVLGLGALLASPAYAAELTLTSTYEWFKADERFGGFSGLEVSADGSRFFTVSDKGTAVSGTIVRSGKAITDIKSQPIHPLKDPDGAPVEKYKIDAEGLAMDGAGQLYVSFEAVHRVWHYFDLAAAATNLPVYSGFKDLQNNSGLEALAVDADGVLYTLPERSGEWTRPFPVFTFKNGKWSHRLKIPRRDKYLPVGADFGPDGKFYLLERDFAWYRGFSTRIRRFTLSDAGFADEETLLTSGFGDYDNLEGLAVWRDQSGGIRLTALSDDNFSILQVTQFVEFSLTE